MKQFKGVLIMQQLKDKECYQMAPVIMVLNSTSEWWIGTLSHRSRDGYWAVNIPGEDDALCTEDFSLHTMRVKDEEGLYNVEPKQWKKLMDVVGKPVDFTKKPLPYKTGFYHQECTACGKDFTAAKQQSRCEDCCKETGTATVSISHTKQPKQANKTLVFTIAHIDVVNDFLKDVIHNGAVNSFEDWLIHKHGSNSIKR